MREEGIALEKVLLCIDEQQRTYVEQLKAFVRIPSVSAGADAATGDGLARAADFLVGQFKPNGVWGREDPSQGRYESPSPRPQPPRSRRIDPPSWSMAITTCKGWTIRARLGRWIPLPPRSGTASSSPGEPATIRDPASRI